MSEGESLAKQAAAARPGFGKATLYTKASTAFTAAAREALGRKDLDASNAFMKRANEMKDLMLAAQAEAQTQIAQLRAKVALQKKPKASAVRKWAGKPSND